MAGGAPGGHPPTCRVVVGAGSVMWPLQLLRGLCQTVTAVTAVIDGCHLSVPLSLAEQRTGPGIAARQLTPRSRYDERGSCCFIRRLCALDAHFRSWRTQGAPRTGRTRCDLPPVCRPVAADRRLEVYVR